MRSIYWLEAKQLDRVTNYSTELEIIKAGKQNSRQVNYYCSFARYKKYFGYNENIKYLGRFNSRIIKSIEFKILVILNAISVVFSEDNSIIMVNQDLIRHVIPARLINIFLKKRNRFIVDIRTTPTNPDTFDFDMRSFHSKFRYAVNHFDGLSFITPFMENILMQNYKKTYKSVNWSSGVDTGLFDPGKYLPKERNRYVLFYHGGISISRGSLDLIKACENLVKDGYEVDLIQIGIVVDKAIIDYLENQNLKSWCMILSPVDLSEIPRMIADCDLPVIPFPNFMAWRVSSPIKLMEYMAMGKKVLAPSMECFTDVFGVNSDMVYYYDLNSGDTIKTLSQSIKKIIDNKGNTERDFCPEIREFVAKAYTWEKQATKLFEFCDSL